MTDSILKSSAISGSFDNLTIVMVVFKNLQNFYDQRKKSKQTQAIKIEGEISQFQQKVADSLGSRNSQDRKEGMIHEKIQRFSDGVNQGYNTAKVGKGKLNSIE